MREKCSGVNGNQPNGHTVSFKKSLELDHSCNGKDPSTTSGHHHNHHHHHHRHHHHVHKEKTKAKKLSAKMERFNRTASVLHQAGLMEMALKTAKIMEENAQLQKDIDALKEDAMNFAKSLQEKLNKVTPASRE